jgi:hypothetical protein
MAFVSAECTAKIGNLFATSVGIAGCTLASRPMIWFKLEDISFGYLFRRFAIWPLSEHSCDCSKLGGDRFAGEVIPFLCVSR